MSARHGGIEFRGSIRLKITTILACMTTVAFVWSYLEFYYQPKPERDFLQAIENQFDAGKDKVMLKEILTSPWTRVCYLTPYTVKKDASSAEIQSLLKIDNAIELPALSELGRYHSAFVFISDQKVVSLFKLKMPYIRTSTGKYPYGLSKSRHYKDVCMKRESAHFRIEHFSQNTKIIFDDNL